MQMLLRTRGRVIALVVGVALCVTAGAGAADAPEVNVPAPWLDVQTRTLHATGAAVIRRDNPNAITKAYQEAENRARLDAVARMTQYIYALETDVGPVGALVEQDPGKKTIVDSYIQGATLLEKRYLPGARMEVDVQLNLTGLDTILIP